MTRYRLVRESVVGPPHHENGGHLVVAQGHPEDGFPSATEAAIWAAAHDLDWRWYIQPIEGTD